MGFGSYDESEQREPEFSEEPGDDETDDLHENEHGGTVSFESGASTDDLLDRLGAIMEESEE